MNVKIVLSATALAATLAFAAPTLAQDKAPADQSMSAPEHQGAHHATRHVGRVPRGRRGARGVSVNMPRHGGSSVDAREREETARLNQEQLHGATPPAPPAHPKGM
jgi:hypothetical protein